VSAWPELPSAKPAEPSAVVCDGQEALALFIGERDILAGPSRAIRSVSGTDNQTPVQVEDHPIETPEVKAGKDEAGSALSIHIRSPVRHVHDRRLLKPVIAVASLPVAVLE
jgi:hypothetical protein